MGILAANKILSKIEGFQIIKKVIFGSLFFFKICGLGGMCKFWAFARCFL